MLFYFDSFHILQATSWLHAYYPQLLTNSAAEVGSTLLSGGHGQGVIADSIALHSNRNLWSPVTAACTLAAQLLEAAPTARLASTPLPELSLEESSFHLQSSNAELSDLDADSAAKGWEGQQQWQSDNNAAVPSGAVALPHKIISHLASHELDVDQSAWAALEVVFKQTWHCR